MMRYRPDLPAATLAAIDEASTRVAAEAPPLTDEQIRALLPLARRRRTIRAGGRSTRRTVRGTDV